MVGFQSLYSNYHTLNSLEQHNYLTVSKSQESGYGLGESAAQGLTRLNWGYWPGCDFIWDSGCSSKLMGYWKNSVPCGCSTEIPALLVVIDWRPLSLPQFYSQFLVPCIVIHDVVFPFSRSAGEPLSFWISLFRNGSNIILRVHLIRSDLRTITFSMNWESTG